VESSAENVGYIYQIMNPNEIYQQLEDKFNTTTNFYSLLNARHQIAMEYIKVATPEVYQETMRIMMV